MQATSGLSFAQRGICVKVKDYQEIIQTQDTKKKSKRFSGFHLITNVPEIDFGFQFDQISLFGLLQPHDTLLTTVIDPHTLVLSICNNKDEEKWGIRGSNIIKRIVDRLLTRATIYRQTNIGRFGLFTRDHVLNSQRYDMFICKGRNEIFLPIAEGVMPVTVKCTGCPACQPILSRNDDDKVLHVYHNDNDNQSEKLAVLLEESEDDAELARFLNVTGGDIYLPYGLRELDISSMWVSDTY